jgi:integral membrane sensor domain MASE1
MTARDRITRRDGRGTRPGGSVPGTLAVAAGYGLAISALIVLSVEHVFGSRGEAGRLAVLGMTVGVLVAAAALMCARRSWQRRHTGRRGNARPT